MICRHEPRRVRRAAHDAATITLGVILLGGQAPVAAQGLAPAGTEADRARQAAQDATAAANSAATESQRLVTARIAAAAALMATEQRTETLAAQIADLHTQTAEAEAAAKAEAARLQPLLPIAERLAAYPIQTLLTVPAAPEDAVRAVLVLQRLARNVRDGLTRIMTEQRRVAALAQALDAARQDQVAVSSRQRDLAEVLDQQIAEARTRADAAQSAANEAISRAAALAARATTLRGAVAAVAADTARKTQVAANLGAANLGAASAAVGNLAAGAGGGWTVPVSGRLLRGFGAADDSGTASGATFAAPASARIVTPCGGRVVFAGLFRSYGQLLIVDCGGGLHAVLAGLGRLDVALGQALQIGEPVGVMGEQAGGTLYFEVRRNGVAIDPRQYLRQMG